MGGSLLLVFLALAYYDRAAYQAAPPVVMEPPRYYLGPPAHRKIRTTPSTGSGRSATGEPPPPSPPPPAPLESPAKEAAAQYPAEIARARGGGSAYAADDADWFTAVSPPAPGIGAAGCSRTQTRQEAVGVAGQGGPSLHNFP